VAWPVAARAQQRPTAPTIGWLDQNSGTMERMSAPFNQGLADAGYVIGRNVNIEYVDAKGDAGRLRALAADLVRKQVAVIMTPSGTAAHAAKAATQTIPIVFSIGGDPVEEGLAASLNRPGGNLTGVAILSAEIAAKRLELLHELVPKADSISALLRPSEGPASSDFTRAQARGLQAAAPALGVRLLLVNAVNGDSNIAAAFASAVEQHAGALLVGAEQSFGNAQAQITSLASRYALPTMFFSSTAVAAGALVSYSPVLSDAYRQVGLYTGRILKGDKPADLPVQQPAKFELAINLKTAKALGLSVPLALLTRADVVIE
jgi:putative ABC transport system substrate-binding protein